MEVLTKENGGSRSASKIELNESTLPLLDDDDGETQEKVELKERSSSSASAGDEKDDSKTEKAGGGDENEEGGADNKKSKSKKKKEKGEHRRSPSCVHTMTVGLNLLDRDEKRINDHVNIQFDDVIAEPDGSHSLDGVWQIAFLTFRGTRVWVYRVLAALFALPFAVCWGFLFALFSFVHIWTVTPLLRMLELVIFFAKKLWSTLVRTSLDPVFESLGLIYSNVRLHHRTEKVVA